jgi:hypothetical protein
MRCTAYCGVCGVTHYAELEKGKLIKPLIHNPLS